MAALEALERLKLPYLLEEERKALCKHKLDLLRLKYQRSGRYEKEDTLRKKVLEAELESTGKAATLPTPLQVKTVKAEDIKFESELPVERSKRSTNEDKERPDLRKWFAHCKKTKQKIIKRIPNMLSCDTYVFRLTAHDYCCFCECNPTIAQIKLDGHRWDRPKVIYDLGTVAFVIPQLLQCKICKTRSNSLNPIVFESLPLKEQFGFHIVNSKILISNRVKILLRNGIATGRSMQQQADLLNEALAEMCDYDRLKGMKVIAEKFVSRAAILSMVCSVHKEKKCLSIHIILFLFLNVAYYYFYF